MGFSAGLANGANVTMRLMSYKDSNERQKKLDERQDKVWAEEDANKEALKKANAAAYEAYQGWQNAGSAATGSPQSGGQALPRDGAMTLGGGATTDGPLTLVGASPALGAMADVTNQARPQTADAGQPAQVPKPRDEREGILAGMQARRKALMGEKVDPKYWMDDWGKEAQLRSQIRSERVDGAEKRFLATGDPGEYARAVYPLIDDGYDFVDAKPVRGLDGKSGWNFVRRDQTSGKEVSSFMDADSFKKFMIGVRDPGAVVQYEAKALLERTKQSEERETNRQKSALTKEEIAARTAGDVAAARERGKQERSTDASKPVTLAPDSTLVRPAKGGKYEVVASGKPRSPQSSDFTLDGRRFTKDENGKAVEIQLPEKKNLPLSPQTPKISNW